MLFRPDVRDGKTIGFNSETPYAFFFFSTKFFPREMHAQYFPQYRFAYLKQVHGKAVLKASPDLSQEGDAHFTHDKNIALVSQSADCTPILLANEKTVCAIHSGWRGTEQNIAGEAESAFPNDPPLVAAIGPHIMKQSFEVGNDVASRLESAPQGKGLTLPHPDEAKKYFDLTEMVRRQLREAFGPALPLYEIPEDTVTNPLFHSYRREKQQAERQFSFVVLKA